MLVCDHENGGLLLLLLRMKEFSHSSKDILTTKILGFSVSDFKQRHLAAVFT